MKINKGDDMAEIVCLLPKPTMEIECLCFDNKPCDIRVNDGGIMVCRHGDNEGVVDGIAKVICPLEIDVERVKWLEFLNNEMNGTSSIKRKKTRSQ